MLRQVEYVAHKLGLFSFSVNGLFELKISSGHDLAGRSRSRRMWDRCDEHIAEYSRLDFNIAEVPAAILIDI